MGTGHFVATSSLLTTVTISSLSVFDTLTAYPEDEVAIVDVCTKADLFLWIHWANTTGYLLKLHRDFHIDIFGE